MLDGYAQHDELAAEVARLGQPAVAMTDHGNMFGSYSFYQAMTKAGVKPILGVEAYCAPASRLHKKPVFWGPGGKRAARDADGESGDVSGAGAYTHLTLLARNATGLRQLYTLSGRASMEGQYPQPKGRMDRELLTEVIEAQGQNIIASTGCPGGEVQTRLRLKQYDEAREAAGFYRDLFGAENYFLELMDHGIAVEKQTRDDLLRLGKELGIRPLATNDSHYVHEHDAEGHDALLCVGVGKNLTDPNRFKFSGAGYYIKSAEQMRALFDDQVPGACDNTLLVASMVESYDEVFAYRNRMPHFPVPEGWAEEGWLREIVYQGLRERYGAVLSDEVVTRAEYELELIIRMGFAGYFLVVHDICRFMREQGIRFGPRGSAAGSIVVYALHIAAMDPLRYKLMFERFINPDRVSPPDIDLDIDESRRSEVTKYLVDKYGADRVSQIITFGRIKARAALRDSARIHGLDYATGDRASKAMPKDIAGFSMPLTACFDETHERYEEALPLRELRASDPGVAKSIETALKLEGRVRTTGMHACGVILANEPLLDQVPLFFRHGKKEKGEPDAILAGHEYPDLESMGLQKMDLLGLSNWTVVDKTIKMVHQLRAVEIVLDDVSFDDPEVYAMLGRGEVLGLFQVSGAGMQTLMRSMKPTSLEDIMAAVALYRPGPMGMQSHINYALRKNGLQKADPIHPELEEPLTDILGSSYGLCLYQEQVIAIVQKVAGYTPGRADLLRKAMGKKKKEVLDKEFPPFQAGMLERGYSQEAVDALWGTLTPFALYGFGLSHSACYAALAYYTAWLKCHYPIEYMAALLDAEDDKDGKAALLAECRRLGITVLVPDVNASGRNFQPVDGEIRFGLGSIRDVGDGVVDAIIAGRADRPYESFCDFIARVPAAGCTKKAVLALIEAGAFDSFGSTRRALALVYQQAVGQGVSLKKKEAVGQFDLFSSVSTAPVDQIRVAIDGSAPDWDKAQRLAYERNRLGLYVSGHPLDDAERALAAYSTTTLVDLKLSERCDGEVHVAGMITDAVRRLTKKNEQMATFVLEDLGGTFRCVVFPKTYQSFAQDIANDTIVSIKGRLNQRDGDEVNIMVDKVRSLHLDDGDIPVLLTVLEQRANAQLMSDLKAILARFPGDRPARVVLEKVDGTRQQYALPGYNVQPGVDFQSEMKALLGRGAVQL